MHLQGQLPLAAGEPRLFFRVVVLKVVVGVHGGLSNRPADHGVPASAAAFCITNFNKIYNSL